MPDRQTQHICYKCGSVMPIEKMGCGCERRCGCTYLQDGARIVCAECATDDSQPEWGDGVLHPSNWETVRLNESGEWESVQDAQPV